LARSREREEKIPRPQSRDGPLTPALSPSEGERGNHRPRSDQSRPVADGRRTSERIHTGVLLSYPPISALGPCLVHAQSVLGPTSGLRTQWELREPIPPHHYPLPKEQVPRCPSCGPTECLGFSQRGGCFSLSSGERAGVRGNGFALTHVPPFPRLRQRAGNSEACFPGAGALRFGRHPVRLPGTKEFYELLILLRQVLLSGSQRQFPRLPGCRHRLVKATGLGVGRG
jgi:hypothetical protein